MHNGTAGPSRLSHSDVVVVGGGPAGAATGYFLARAGVQVTILDRAHFPRDKPCAEYLSPQASRILSAMGVEEQILAAGAAALTGMIVTTPNGSTFRGDFAATHPYTPFRTHGIAARRSVVDAIVLDAARRAGAVVIEGARVEQLVRDESGVVTGVSGVTEVSDVTEVSGVTEVSDKAPAGRAANDRDRFVINAKLVVGADGLNSVVASRAGMTRRRRWPRRIAMVAHFTDVADPSNCGEMHVERHGYLGIARTGHNDFNVALVVDRSLARDIRGEPRRFMQSWIDSHPALAKRFRNAVTDGHVLTAGPFARFTASPIAPGVALVGDAADFFDPFTGEGIYSALRSGELLAHHVTQQNWPQQNWGLVGYARDMAQEFTGKRRVERLVGSAVASPAMLNHVARALGKRKELADLLVGVAGDFVPASAVLNPGFLVKLLW